MKEIPWFVGQPGRSFDDAGVSTAIELRFVDLLVARHGSRTTCAGSGVCPSLLWVIGFEVIGLVGSMVENHFWTVGCYLGLRIWMSLRKRPCGSLGLYRQGQPFEVYARTDGTLRVSVEVVEVSERDG